MKTYHVYAIVNSLTQDAYIGCTTRFKTRCLQHWNRLAQGSHPNRPLQAAWSETGPASLDFIVLSLLEEVTLERARSVEQSWIDKIGTYNVVGGDEAKLEILWPEQRRKIMAENVKLRWADLDQRAALMNAPNRGKSQYKGMPDPRTPEGAASAKAKLKAAWADPEKSAKLKERQQSRWKDPEAKARQSKKMRAYHAARREVVLGSRSDAG